ncbi:MAG: sodium:alanine symporter family protein [Bacteroidetes bacterium HGW-Bacteroidetes-1]|jgi:AGCS family alanine or glycine:cation symporter|nr:MAG: sodium:alanine symporter family protein [Bacteroidetes bacterium HGW-Bacteroidetes-1]
MTSFLEFIDQAIQWYNGYVGGYLILALLIPTGIWFAFRLNFLNLTKIGHAIRVVSGKYDVKGTEGDVNHFKALTTALSATVGTGNIVGVALAIYLGGPGAIFWMWVTGFLGMMLKYAEVTLAHKFRKFNSDGTVSGGPMYYMEFGLKEKIGKWAKILALVFASATILCSLGTGNMAQSNSMSDAMFASYSIPTWISGFAITFLVLLVIIGGIKRIADVTSRLVPIMAFIYILAAMTVIITEWNQIPKAFSMIITSAFTGTAATGGFVGSTFIMTLIWGVRRGLFSNEAGQGSAPIAHAAARTKYPAREGIVALLEPMIDTIIICTMTALMIIVTDAWQTGNKGVGMTVDAMNIGLHRFGIDGMGGHIIAFSILLFAFSTIISWSYYGSRAVIYLIGEKAVKPYLYLYGMFVFLGSIWGLDIVWHFVDMVITFMTIPNLIALLLLSGVVVKETKNYFKDMTRTHH